MNFWIGLVEMMIVGFVLGMGIGFGALIPYGIMRLYSKIK